MKASSTIQKFIAAVFAIASITACGEASVSTAKQTDDSGFRDRIVRCDNGAIEVLVDLRNRRNLLAVVTEPTINSFFRSASGLKLLDGRGNQGAITMFGSANDGVFSASGFSGFLGETREPVVEAASYDAIVQFRVYRSGSGLNTEIWRDSMTSNGEGGSFNRTPLRKVADWHFQDCANLD